MGRVDPERYEALVELLDLPDEVPDDGRRGHRLTAEGHPERFGEVPFLAQAYAQYRIAEFEEGRS